ncbi:RNA-dependent RNA polymerase [Botrytis cinerea ourmia-like virus 1]|uniref:RNA-dependent RNA polymerase n=1 Tax=Botrytis cinerea ourmia-like virus 1 TaxID=2735943 RepID=A0ABX6NZ59_9VIRU|nr:RNA-dependent RNA polymerase [Botrytis cinerea ourmia-like virus 1]QJT73667.1 RNA-dependent RNA polymerase [Botrytis cinerea ourmia-like virus 1]
MSEQSNSSVCPMLGEHRVPLRWSQEGQGRSNRRSGEVGYNNLPTASARALACSLPLESNNQDKPNSCKGTNERLWTVYRAREKKRNRRIRADTRRLGGNRNLAEKVEQARHLVGSLKNFSGVEEWVPYNFVATEYYDRQDGLVLPMRKSGKEKSAPVENRYMCLSEPRITGEENFVSGTPKDFDFLRAAYTSQRDRMNFRISGCVIGCTGQGSPSGGTHASGCDRYIPPPEETLDIPMPALSLDSPTSCQNSRHLRSLFKQCQKLLARDRGMKGRPLSHSLECGGLRSALEESYDQPSLVEQMSLKTTQKLEPQPCEFCKERFALLVDNWKEKRKQEVEVDEDHLSLFQKAFNMNIGVGWNLRHRSPFVPNGHGSYENTRLTHGNWNLEEFSSEFRTELVFSSGKPRIVTLYSSMNTKLLKPLHSALFGHIKNRSWLLVGPPTNERVATLNGGAYESFDYKDATNNIKQAYVKVAIDSLIKKGVDLSCNEIEALQVVSHLSLDGEICGSGQPMGSLMSFPLLCLINKTMVDLALADTLFKDKSIDRKDAWIRFCQHRCLINGDDLGLRDPGKPGVFRKWLIHHGRHVGLTVNEEKSLRSDTLLEINSTVFSQGEIQKKTNCGVLRNRSMDTGDFLGIAKDATVSSGGLRYVLRSCADSFGLQTHKHIRKHPELIGYLSNEPKMRESLTKQKKLKSTYNPFPVEKTPAGYHLSNEEVFNTLSQEVERVRPLVLGSPKDKSIDEFEVREYVREEIRLVSGNCCPPPAKYAGGITIDSTGANTMVFYHHEKDYFRVSVNRRLREKYRQPDDTTLVCLVDEWKRKKTRSIDLEVTGSPDVCVYDTTPTTKYFGHLVEKIKKHVTPDKKTDVEESLKQISPINAIIKAIKSARATQTKVKEFLYAPVEEHVITVNETMNRDFTPLHDEEDLEIVNSSSNQPAFEFAESLCSLKGMVPAY